jgi:very-short-patch-repair endonuclease
VPKCVFVTAVDEALSALELSPNTETSSRWVVLRWHAPPRIDEAIRLVLYELASVARAAWPHWFGFDHGTGLPPHDRLVAVAQRASLSPDWIRQAWNACGQHLLPLAAEHPPVVTLRHLTAAIAEDELAIVLAVDSGDRSDVHLDGICRMTQWLAANSAARCSLLLSTALYGSPELASVDYEPMFWTLVRQPTPDAPPRPDENKVRLWPLLGRPHPLSPGEQKLYQTLQADTMLAAQFQFNCPVTTELGNTYIVDLLADALKVVVEVDGYRHHSNRVAFGIDRQRDYELHTSGYLVLRLPHDDIMQDLEACMEKIRRFLAFRQQHPIAIG